MRPSLKVFLRAGSAAVLMTVPLTAHAHAFGSRYELSIPVWLFILGGAVTVTVTFLLVSVFTRTNPQRYSNLRYDLLQHAIFRLLFHPSIILFLRWVAVAVLGIILLAGFIGSTNPNHNISPTLVWAIWWAGFSYLAMLVGNLWPILNPWHTLFDRMCNRKDQRREFSRKIQPYPQRLNAWPAVVLFLGFAWIELIFPFRARPSTISVLILSYSVLTWAGMYRYGAEVWLKNVDPFNIIFALYARFAPLAPGATDSANGLGRGLILRPYAAGLLQPGGETVSLSVAAFILAMLAMVLFDGLLGSAHWLSLENIVHELNPKLGDAGWILVHSAGLLVTWGIFLVMFLGTCKFMSHLTKTEQSTRSFACAFALTLIPIVIGYQFAHTFPFLLVQGQYIVPLLSDPFGYGWNLFGTKNYQVDIAIINTRTAWYLAVVAIVAGHVVSVYLAHVAAVRLIDNRTAALKALIPMTALMVTYTVVSLSILAEPLVKYTGPNNEIIRLPAPLWRPPSLG